MTQNELVKLEVRPMTQRKPGTMPTPQELQNFINVCNVLGTCPYYAKMGPGGVLAIYLSAMELGLPPMGCLNGGMHVIEGKVTISAQYMNMMIVQAGHRADVLYLNAEGCKIRFVRTDRVKGEGDTFEYEFTMQDAQRAGYFGIPGPNGSYVKKPKDNWINSPRDMFYSRCLSGGARKFMPDVLMNVYVIGEMPGDEEIKGILPENVNASQVTLSELPAPNVVTQQLTEQKPALTVDQQKYDDFVQRHGIFEEGSDKHDYLQKILSASIRSGKNRTLQDVINSACLDEQRFMDAYHGWKLKQVSGPKDKPSEN